MKNDYNGRQAETWRRPLRKFLGKLRKTYPDAHIICCTINFCHDCLWTRLVDEVVDNMNDKMITHYVYGRNGFGTPGHLRIPEA